MAAADARVQVVRAKALSQFAGAICREIDEVLGWETGKSARIRRVTISRKAVVISAIERMRKRDKKD
jgi:hypothetical protein